MATTAQRSAPSQLESDGLVVWSVLLFKVACCVVFWPVLLLALPVRALTRRAAWWLVVALAILAALLVLGDASVHGYRNASDIGALYVAGLVRLAAWCVGFLPMSAEVLQRLPPEPARFLGLIGEALPMRATPGQPLPPPEWTRSFRSSIWRGAIFGAAVQVACQAIADRLRRPLAGPAGAPGLPEKKGSMAAAVTRHEDGRWQVSAGARFRHWRTTAKAWPLPGLPATITHPKDRAIVGYLAGSRVGRTVRLSLDALVRHVFLVGATGFGKTTLLLHLIDAALKWGWAVILVDCKGDPDLITYAVERGGDVWTPGGARKWDALKGNRTQVADRLVAGEMTHSDAKYYPEIMGRYLQDVLGVLDTKHGEGKPAARDPHEIARLLHPEALKAEVAALLKTGQHDGLRPLLATIGQDYTGDQHTEAALLGFRHRFNRLLSGVVGPSLGPGVGLDRRPALELERSVKSGQLVLFSVPTDAYQGAGKKVAMWAILGVQALTAELRADYYARMGGRLLFVVDEFAQLEEETTRMGPLLRMARSAGVGVILAAQGTTDLFAKVDARTAKTTLASIMNACATKIVMHLGSEDDREVWVAQHGDQEVEARTARYNADGEVAGQSVTTKRQPTVTHDELRHLAIGQAIVEVDEGLLRVLVPARRPASPPAPRGAGVDGDGVGHAAEASAGPTPSVAEAGARVSPAGAAPVTQPVDDVVDVEVVSSTIEPPAGDAAGPGEGVRRPLPPPLGRRKGQGGKAIPNVYDLVE
jgi:hypothetical protein